MWKWDETKNARCRTDLVTFGGLTTQSSKKPIKLAAIIARTELKRGIEAPSFPTFAN